MKNREIALTFDDGPNPETTPRILEILREYGVRATFFPIGKRAHAHPELVRAVIAEGHTVGSHTWSHPQLPNLPFAEALKEVKRGRRAITLACGVKTSFFRFPFGARTPELQQAVKKLGLATFQWNMNPRDWLRKTPRQIYRDAIAEIDREGSGIILLHDSSKATAIALPHLLKKLQARGFTAVVFVPNP